MVATCGLSCDDGFSLGQMKGQCLRVRAIVWALEGATTAVAAGEHPKTKEGAWEL